jgi:hypothetical protein
VIGKIIKKTDLVFSTIKMVINMKEGGAITKGMAKAHFGYVTLKIN